MADKHKCTDCGFLALRRWRTDELVEASLVYRTEGTVPLRDDLSDREDTRRAPVCYKRRRDFLREIMDEQQKWIAKGSSPEFPRSPVLNPFPDPEAAHPYIMVIMLSEQIECDGADGYTDYIQGLSPKEHQEMLDRQRKIEQERKVREMVWAREDKRDEKADTQHKEQLKVIGDQHAEQLGVMKSQHKSDLRVFGVWVTAAIVVSGILGAMIQAGWIIQPRFWF